MGTMGRKPAPQPLTFSDTAAAPDEDDQRTGETLQVISPADSRSPRSPRSPFRLTQKKAQPVGGKQPLHVADLVQHQQPVDQETRYAQSSASNQPYAPDFRHQQQQQDRERPQTHSQSRSRHRQNEEKASKSGFFFNFSKSAKSTERLQLHQQTDSRNEAMSRGVDHPPVTKPSPKLPGMDCTFRRGDQQRKPAMRSDPLPPVRLTLCA